MKTEDRKAAVADYKKRKSSVGIYAVRCASSGETWVGQSLSLDSQQNRMWFTLRLGSCPNPALQAAWRTHGGDSFAFEQLEQLEDEETLYIRDAILKERLAAWQAKLGARRI